MADPREDVRDAATVIVGRDTSEGLEVFMVRRHAGAAFLPDRYVFPGGRVDDADRDEATRRLRGSAGDVDPAYAMTAARETFEEVGLLFAGSPVNLDALAELRREMNAGQLAFGECSSGSTPSSTLPSCGTSRAGSRRRRRSRRAASTRDSLSRVPRADQVAEADAAEVSDGRWFAPHEALAAHARAEINLIFPTIKHLERIAPYRDGRRACSRSP